MTSEEANKVLGDVSAYLASRASLENERLAGHTFTDICKAIKVLRQEPCGKDINVPATDAISRQAVIDCFKKWQPYMATRLHEFEKELFELPSVQPEPFINKPCISEGVCHEDKIKVLDKLRAELHATAEMHEDGDYYLRDEWIDEYFDAHKAESEG